MKAILLIARLKSERETLSSLEEEELRSLALTAYLNPVTCERVALEKINPALFVGSGKAGELKNLAEKHGAGWIIFNRNLTPNQQRNLEQAVGTGVADRTFLILKIFEQRARTMEGKLQVEMANFKYALSRISGRGVSMDQQAGMIGTRGSGEKKIEYDKRELRVKISELEKKIKKVRTDRQTQREARKNLPMPQISIVGYTNAGKSTLLNALTKGRHEIYADDKLFATLDAVTKRVRLEDGSFALFSDTVGFINGLPHLLIAAFHSTLEEIKYSDAIIHLHDISSPYFENQNKVVKETLSEIGAKNIPVINVFNKTDKLQNDRGLKSYFSEYDPVFISAAAKTGLKEMLEKVSKTLGKRWKNYSLRIPFEKSEPALKLARDLAFVLKSEYGPRGLALTMNATEGNYKRFMAGLKKL